MEILQEFLQEECISSCNKKWLTIAKDILQRNSIPEADFTEAVRNCLVKGRGKYRNILLKGPANCGYIHPQSTKFNFSYFQQPCNIKFCLRRSSRL